MRCWVSRGAETRARWEPKALQRALHGGVVVAAAGAVLGGVAERGGSSAMQRRAVEVQRDAWKLPGKQEVARGGGSPRRAGGARHWRRETEEQTGGRRKGLVCKFRKFQGPRCKSKITFNIGLK